MSIHWLASDNVSDLISPIPVLILFTTHMKLQN